MKHYRGLAALELIEQMAADRCQCDTASDKPSCGFCEIYTIAHGATGCGAPECPSAAKGVREIKKFMKTSDCFRRWRTRRIERHPAYKAMIGR